MALRKFSFAQNEFYHLYNRGNDKRIIFETNQDRQRFLELLYLTNTDKPVSIKDTKRQYSTVFEHKTEDRIVAIGSYCLMPNHFHILVTPLVENGISIFMKKLMTGYSMYFNKKYERTGSLFEGRFKAQHANSDEYLKYLFSYIHLNPVKLIQPDWRVSGIEDLEKAYSYITKFKYSSLIDYQAEEERKESLILTPDKFPEYFNTKATKKRELIEWLKYQPDSNN